jgi:CRISPR system Cascade subunit CasA
LTDLAGARAEAGPAQEALTAWQARAAVYEKRVAAGEDDRSLALAAKSEAIRAEGPVRDIAAREAAAQAAFANALTAPVDQVRAIIVQPEPVRAYVTTSDAFNQAVLARSDVLKAAVDYDLAESALRLEVARQFPEVKLGPGFAYDTGFVHLPFDLTLVLPPADGNRAAIAAAEARRTEAAKAVDEAQARVLAALTEAEAQVAAALDRQAKVRQIDMPNVRRSASLISTALRGGAADRTEAWAAQAAEAEVLLEEVRVSRAYYEAGAALEDALRTTWDAGELMVLKSVYASLGEGQ